MLSVCEPEEEYLKTLLWEELGQALSELPPPQREAFEKTELHGYSIKMLAEESGASEQALLSRKHKAVLLAFWVETVALKAALSRLGISW